MQKQGKAVQKNLMSRYYSPSNICCTIADDDHKNLLLGTLRVYAWRHAVSRQKNMKGIYSSAGSNAAKVLLNSEGES